MLAAAVEAVEPLPLLPLLVDDIIGRFGLTFCRFGSLCRSGDGASDSVFC